VTVDVVVEVVIIVDDVGNFVLVVSLLIHVPHVLAQKNFTKTNISSTLFKDSSPEHDED
jgi:hypothetical protein